MNSVDLAICPDGQKVSIEIQHAGQFMLTEELHTSLVYLDRDFVAGKYEIISGHSPSSQITKTQGKKAGAAIPVFSAEVSAIETRTFPISSLEMLATVMPAIRKEGEIDPSGFKRDTVPNWQWGRSDWICRLGADTS